MLQYVRSRRGLVELNLNMGLTMRGSRVKAPIFFSKVTRGLANFKPKCNVSVASHWGGELADVENKVYA